jgi:hypothetical protein
MTAPRCIELDHDKLVLLDQSLETKVEEKERRRRREREEVVR